MEERQLSLLKGQRQRGERMPAAVEFHLHCMTADLLRRWCKPGWIWTHLPLGEYRTAATAGRLKRMGVAAGWPDLILLSPSGAPHFLELKRKGRGLSPEQRDFASWCVAHKVQFTVADSFDEAMRILRIWGAVCDKIRA